MLFLGNVTLATGISHYYGDILAGDSRKALGPLSLMTFVLLVAIFETIYRLRNRYSLRQIKPEKLEENKKLSRRSLTSDEVEEAVRAGQKLVIYDNLVLDTADYYHMHPGGKFNILHNIGRDITKFFNGAYILVNDKKNKPYTHSAAALDIVKSMIIGDLNGQSQIKDEKFKLFDKKQVNSDTCTFTFAATEGQPIPNLKSWYNDPNMIGRHFVVYSSKAPQVKRQYTICSSMNKNVKQALLDLAQGVIDKKETEFDYKIMLGQDQTSVDLTLKNYGVKGGLATRIHNTEVSGKGNSKSDDTFYIKGPMGKGLEMQSEGTHLAFCAGTGALVFIDLVSHLIVLNSFKATSKGLPKEMQDFYKDGFKLHLYCSFANRDQAIGLELVEALQRLNDSLGLDNFEATIRLSKTDDGSKPLPRWDKTFIENEVSTKKNGKIAKIWAVGPPAMNQLFDQTLNNEFLARQNLLSKQVEVM